MSRFDRSGRACMCFRISFGLRMHLLENRNSSGRIDDDDDKLFFLFIRKAARGKKKKKRKKIFSKQYSVSLTQSQSMTCIPYSVNTLFTSFHWTLSMHCSFNGLAVRRVQLILSANWRIQEHLTTLVALLSLAVDVERTSYVSFFFSCFSFAIPFRCELGIDHGEYLLVCIDTIVSFRSEWRDISINLNFIPRLYR